MADCAPLDWKCGAADFIGGLGDDAMANMAKAIMEGMSQMVTTLSTFWVSTPTVNLTSQDGSTASPVVSMVNSELMPWTLALAVLAVILGGIRLIWEQRGAPLKDLLRSLVTLTLVSGLGLGVISILVIAADAFSAAIIDRSTDGKGFAEWPRVAADGDLVVVTWSETTSKSVPDAGNRQIWATVSTDAGVSSSPTDSSFPSPSAPLPP